MSVINNYSNTIDGSDNIHLYNGDDVEMDNRDQHDWFGRSSLEVFGNYDIVLDFYWSG